MTRSTLLASLLFACVTLAFGALAAPPDPQERTYQEAQNLYLAKRYAEALPLFQQLAEDSGSPNARLYVARCLRALGRLPEAYDEAAQTERDAAERAPTEPRFAPTRDAAARDLEQLEAKVGRVVLHAEQREGLAVVLNGRPVAASRFGLPLGVAPGTVLVSATAPGTEPFRTERTVPAGGVETIAVVLREIPPAPVPTPAASSSPPSQPPPAATTTALPPAPSSREPEPEVPPAQGTPGTLTGGIAMLGVGVLGAVAWIVGWRLSEDRFDEVMEKCGHQRCTDPRINDSIDEGRIMDYVATGGAGLTVLGVVTSAILFTIYGVSDAGDEESAQPPSLGVAPLVTPAGVSLGLRGTF